jgi:hypothetical protein
VMQFRTGFGSGRCIVLRHVVKVYRQKTGSVLRLRLRAVGRYIYRGMVRRRQRAVLPSVCLLSDECVYLVFCIQIRFEEVAVSYFRASFRKATHAKLCLGDKFLSRYLTTSR